MPILWKINVPLDFTYYAKVCFKAFKILRETDDKNISINKDYMEGLIEIPRITDSYYEKFLLKRKNVKNFLIKHRIKALLST